MKKIFLLTATVAAMCACAPKVTITVDNTLPIDRGAELVEIPVSGLNALPLAEGEAWVVKRDGQTIPSQVTHDGLLIFQSSLGANEKATFTVTAGTPVEYPVKACARFAPERFDDMVWENDRVAFRIYAAALMAKDGPSNGIDALYKRSENMVIDAWYEGELQRGESYHDDHGTGLDDYNVRRSLGAGAAAPFVDGELVLNSNFTSHEILDNGPLRATFRLSYPDLGIGATTAAETRTISLDAGSQLSRVTQEYGVSTPLTVAVGFPLRTPEVKWRSEGSTLMVEEPATRKASGVFLGAVLSVSFEATMHTYTVVPPATGVGVYHHALALVPYTPGTPFTYYTGFGWEKWGDWTAESFSRYLADFSTARNTPFVIAIK